MKKIRFGVLLFSSISCSSSYATPAWLTLLELDMLLKPVKIEAHYEIMPDTPFWAYPLCGRTEGAEGGGHNQPPPDREEFELNNPETSEEEPPVSLSVQNLQSSMAGQSQPLSRSDEITLEQLQKSYPHIHEMIKDITNKHPRLIGSYDPSRQVNGLPLFILTHKVLKALDSAIKKLKSQDKYKPQKKTFGTEFFSLFTTLHINLLTHISDFSILTTILSMYFEQPATMVQLVERVQNTAESLHHQGLLQGINQSQLVTLFIQQIATWSSSCWVATSLGNGNPTLPWLIIAFTNQQFQNILGQQEIRGSSFSEERRNAAFRTRRRTYPHLLSSITSYFNSNGVERHSEIIADYLIHIIRRNPRLFYAMMTNENRLPSWITENTGADNNPLLQRINSLAQEGSIENATIMRLLTSPDLVQSASTWLAEQPQQTDIPQSFNQDFLQFLDRHLPKDPNH